MSVSRIGGADAAGPGTPLIFQGQEFSASTPFLYFAVTPELREPIRERTA